MVLKHTDTAYLSACWESNLGITQGITPGLTLELKGLKIKTAFHSKSDRVRS